MNIQKFLLAASLLSFPASGFATTYQIATSQTLVDANTLTPKPVGGDIVEILSGTRLGLQLRNFTGSAGNPIIFRNSGGQVVISDPNANSGINFINSKFFRITGSGDPRFFYGFKVSVSKAGSVGVGFGALSTEFEMDRIEVASAGFAGVMSKTDPGCDSSAWRGNFIQRNTYFHDNYIHDTGGEGFYVGNTSWGGKTITCSGASIVVYPHEIRGVGIYNNIVTNTGWDGIQLSCATENARVEGNHVSNFGLEDVSGQNQGIQLGAGSDADVFNNVIETGRGAGIMIFGLGGSGIYNNIIYQPDGDGIFCDDRATTPGLGWYFNNNTIIRPGRHGMCMYSDLSTGSTFYNNIVVGPARLVGGSYFYRLNTSVQLAEGNGYYTADINAVKFVNTATRDFHLQTASPAVNAGRTISAYNYDLNYFKRPFGAAYDIGAAEQVGALLLQDFSGVQNYTSYVDAAAPTTGQFNDISAEAGGGVWSISGARLQLTRAGISGATNGAGFSRYTNFAGAAPTVLYATFDFSLTNFNTTQNDSMAMDFCNAATWQDYNSSTPSTGVFASLRVDGSGSNTFKFEVGGTRSAALQADGTIHEVSVYLNKSGIGKSYKAPNGTIQTVNNNAVSVWVGTTAVIQNATASNGATSTLTDLRARFVAPDAGTWRFDNFAVFGSLPQ